MNTNNKLFILLLIFLFSISQSGCNRYGMKHATSITQLTNNVLKGWNTWNNPNLLSFVHMPDGLSLRVTYRKKRGGPYWVNQSYVVQEKSNIKERIIPIAHAYDGSYIEMELNWAGTKSNIKAAHDGDDIVILVTPITMPDNAFLLVLEAGILWNKPDAMISKKEDFLNVELGNKKLTIRAIGEHLDHNFDLPTQHLTFQPNQSTVFYTGKKRTLEEVQAVIAREEKKFSDGREKYGELKNAYEAMQAVIAWNIFYDAKNDRVLTSVSRVWNEAWGGYIIFDWDTYFAALMLATDQKELSYATAISITNGITDKGFIPNVDASFNVKSNDRSQPPVGSMCVKLIYDKYGEKWFLEQVYDNLLSWNRWWDKNRNNKGYLSWGSDPHPQGMDGHIKQGAHFESGLDNSPLFDDAIYNAENHMLELASVDLMSLYVMDCNYLAEIATVLGKDKDAKELKARSEMYGKKLQELWDDKTGIFRDKYLDRNEFSKQLAPTNFYPLLAKVATQEQAERMITGFFMNPKEFYGEFMMPSISRSSPAFNDNDYWRGPIWAPMNFLVYMGLRNYNLPEARKVLVEKSKNLILKEWKANRHVYENYHADKGTAGGKINSDPFYSWGGLLAFIALMEEGHFIRKD